ncbi:hypothetical protein [Rhodanobacter sp. DHB23]|uniref:hypothetical protein n=1 Tax=Rhodanobacter sp. DHB23 TaxID=2775923 RepID=UPI00178130FE|nr:hypothetical protein [Rhodanobacter sp. DHB23]MBD8872879.1 hypothetical protein [Rhodanobacter sp. DHB23]
MIHLTLGDIDTRPGPCVPVKTNPRVGYTSELVEQLFVPAPPKRMQPELGDWATTDAEPIDVAAEIAAFVNL